MFDLTSHRKRMHTVLGDITEKQIKLERYKENMPASAPSKDAQELSTTLFALDKGKIVS